MTASKKRRYFDASMCLIASTCSFTLVFWYSENRFNIVQNGVYNLLFGLCGIAVITEEIGSFRSLGLEVSSFFITTVFVLSFFGYCPQLYEPASRCSLFMVVAMLPVLNRWQAGKREKGV